MLKVWLPACKRKALTLSLNSELAISCQPAPHAVAERAPLPYPYPNTLGQIRKSKG